jgi:hypothetical protein
LTPGFRKAVPLLPPITLYHGTADYSIPHEARYFQNLSSRLWHFCFESSTNVNLLTEIALVLLFYLENMPSV